MVIRTIAAVRQKAHLLQLKHIERSVICIETQEKFDSPKQAADTMQIDLRWLRQCLNYHGNTVGGLHWCYEDELENFTIPIAKWEPKEVYCIERKQLFESAKQAAQVVGHTTGTSILACCRKQNHTAGGLHWCFPTDLKDYQITRPNFHVVQCIETGIIYNSAAEAARAVGTASGSAIINACNKSNLTVGNYHWCFPEDYSDRVNMKLRKKTRPVRCIETNQIYESITIASECTNINRKCINDACLGRQHTAGGYHWIYEDI